MLTTGREIKNKQDRYGSFERNSFDKVADLGLEDNANNLTINNIMSVNDTSVVNGGVDLKPKTTVKLGGKRLTVSDSYVEKVSERKSNVVAGVQSKSKVTTKNIVMICAYCLVVVALITVIALNANALKGVSEKNAGLQNEIASLTQTYNALSTELLALTDEARIAELALNTLNLTESSAKIIEMSAPKLLPKAEVVHQTNWFDQLCDSISSVFGG